ncbi:hypothetical protein A2U01_0046459, partial [Trifolium medium]|nr:hypothetical protein [Trifolium medium]
DAGCHDGGKAVSAGFCIRNSDEGFVTATTSWKTCRISTVKGGGSSSPRNHAICV